MDRLGPAAVTTSLDRNPTTDRQRNLCTLSMVRSPMTWLHRLQGPIAALVVLAMTLPGLGTSGLLDPWEMDRAAVARLVAGSPQVLVVDEDGALLSKLDDAAGEDLSLRRVSTQGAGSAAAGLSRAPNELSERVHHAVVIDADAVISGRAGDEGAELLAGRIDTIGLNNRGTLVALVTSEPIAKLRAALARARARQLVSSMSGGWWQHALPAEKDAANLALLAWHNDTILPRDKAAKLLVDVCPSPWSLVQHKVKGASVQAPMFDTMLVAASMKALGASEFSARLPGALIAAIMAWLLVVAASSLYGPAGGWLALLVFATMPAALGAARMVTLAQTASLGSALLALGLARGANPGETGRWWLLWAVLGLDLLFFGQGLGGLSIGVAVVVGYVFATRDMRREMLGLAAVAGVGLALAAWIVLSDDDSALLRTLRFTQVPFGGGLPEGRRDFAELISHLGFGMYPWGPIFLIACGRRLFGAGGDSPESASPLNRSDVALLIGLGAPILGTAVLLPDFNHVAMPVVAVAAVITASLLVDLLAGRVSGAVLTLMVFVPALLLHREIGKEAGTMVRWLAFDPPIGDDKAAYSWPQELAFNKNLRRLALLLTLGFGLGLSRPVDATRRLLDRLQSRAAAIWALSAVAVAYALDVLISLGTRLDVLLRAEATRTGYTYDRVWTTIQMTRPEVVAGAALFVAVFLGAALVHLGATRGWGEKRLVRLLRAVARLFGDARVALAAIGAACIGLLISGCLVLTSLHPVGWGGTLAEGATSAAFLVPLILAILVAVVAALPGSLGRRFEWAADDRGTALAAIVRVARGGRWLAIGALVLVAIGGLGVGASQVAGTWTYGYLAACWCVAVAVALTVAARGNRLDALGGIGIVIAIAVAANVWSVLAGRLLGEPNGPGLKYFARLLIASPDAAGLLVVAGLVVLNRAAVRRPAIDLVRGYGLSAANLLQRPGPAIFMLGAAAAIFATGYAHGLLPGMSLHFSQKHLIARVDAVGGTVDGDGVPRTFKHASGGRSSIQNNFYTRSMPTIADREAVLDLLAGLDVGTRVSDFGETSRSIDLAIPGWRDENDTDKDGKRDHKAFTGLADKVDGLQVDVAVRAGRDKESVKPWAKNAWKGARLHIGDDHSIGVLGNGARSLQLAGPTPLVPGDARRAVFSLDSNPGEGIHRASAMLRGARYAVLAKDEFSMLNHAFRVKHGRHIRVLDARSSRLVLAASHLPDGAPDENWLAKAVIDAKTFDGLKGVTKVAVNWNDEFHMIGYSLASRSVRRSQKYLLKLYLKVIKAPSVSWKLFMHPHPLHRDLWPLAYKKPSKATEKSCSGCFRSDHWRPGDIVVFPIEQEVPLGTNAGANDVILGWYNPLSDKRLQVIQARGPGVIKHRDNRLTLTKLQVR